MYLVGIDVGGTKSDFLLCDENENEISRVILGAGNPNDIGIDECITLLGEGLDALCGNITPATTTKAITSLRKKDLFIFTFSKIQYKFISSKKVKTLNFYISLVKVLIYIH
mgnify:CR=1 FL=1